MENGLVLIPEKNIFLEFALNKQKYIVFSKTLELQEGDKIYFAKVDYLDGQKIARSIESDKEYIEVEKEYERILNEYLENDDDKI